MAWSIWDNGGTPAVLAFAVQFLKDAGAPVTPGNLTFVYQWAKSEGGGGVNNPFNTGPVQGLATSGNQYGGGAANYPSLAAAAQASVDVLNERFPYYSDVLTNLRANNPSGARDALIKSPWAGSHYGGGRNWSTAVPPGGAPLSSGGGSILSDIEQGALAAAAGPAGAIVGLGGNSVSGLASLIPSLGSLLGTVTSKALWIRAGEMVAGLLIAVIGVFWLFHKDAGALIKSSAKAAELVGV